MADNEVQDGNEITPEKVEKILEFVKTFQKDSKVYSIKGINFNQLLSSNLKSVISEIRHDKFFLLTMFTDEPNLLVLIGDMEKEELAVICFENSYKKHKELIQKIFPETEITQISDVATFFKFDSEVIKPEGGINE